MLLDQQKEIVKQSFSKTFDLEMAYRKAGLPPDIILKLNRDKEFQHCIYLYLIKEREKLVCNFRKFMDSKNEKIAFEATKEFTSLLYPEYFLEPKRVRKLPEKTEEGFDFSEYSDEDLKELLDDE